MRQHDDRKSQDATEVIKSDPVPVPGEPDFHPPAPVPTAFGATTVGGAVAASAMASGRAADERDPRGEDTARPGDGTAGQVGAEADPEAGHPLPEAGRRAPGNPDPDATARFAPPTADPDATARFNPPAADLDATTRFNPPAADPDATTRFDALARPGQRGVAPVDDAPGYGRATPTMVDPDGTATPAGAHRPAAGGPDSAAAGPAAGTGEPFLSGTQEYRDRWREVQLRFVDDPRAAAGEAREVVGDAIEAVARALAARRDELDGWQQSGSEDTEQLRVVVRRYRDLLDRLLGL
ncbi:hypothetical protein [Micromonospora echinofusca]|uniref:Uncharacterized protein n=1 Tax=Micromonospora echinofusca TaxID=47858 RepID=A0ABS3VZU2_MICEH|nr:hypothetical protein [Micromonospora echinofusca]MBO4210060.1 hypothetical protein [Micromonospora echinofusca]